MINGLPENSSAFKPQRRGLIHWGLILNFALVNALSKQSIFFLLKDHLLIFLCLCCTNNKYTITYYNSSDTSNLFYCYFMILYGTE